MVMAVSGGRRGGRPRRRWLDSRVILMEVSVGKEGDEDQCGGGWQQSDGDGGAEGGEGDED